jgi:folate-binding protein YgfZ
MPHIFYWMTDPMNRWLQFLTESGAQLEGDTHEVRGFGHEQADTRAFVAPLSDLGLISITGDDAAAFLHNQLTNDVEHLGPTEARLAGYCSAKGRLLATFLMWKSADAVFLQLPRHLQAAVQKRLQMFVLRAKAKLADASDDKVALGIVGESAATLLAQWFPDVPATPYAKAETEAGVLIRVPDAFGAPRYQWIAPVDMAQKAWPLLMQALPPLGTAAWRRTEINAGVPQITQPTQEQFVPQMINFELIGGVNFRKGCYPGQEIVARSQYLGKLKRRMVLATLATQDAKPGMEVFSGADPDQPCGMIVNAERNPSGGMDCLVELKLTALQDGVVHAGSPSGPVLTIGELPYPLADPA